MRGKAINAYIFIVLVLFNALSLNLNILGLKLETLLLLIAAIGVFVVSIICQYQSIDKYQLRRKWKEIPVTDLGMGILCIMEIGWIIYQLVVNGCCKNTDILLLVLVISYFIIDRYQGKYYNYLFAFSIANVIVYIGLLYSAITGKERLIVGGYLLQEQDILSWLVFTIATGIVAYCTDKHLYLWYAIQVLMGSFLLFLQKNFLSMGIVTIVFLLVLFFAPLNQKLIKKVGMLLLGYACLFINMSFIVNYTNFLKNPMPYSIEMSVYLNFVLAGVMLILYICWNRWNKRAITEEQICKRVKRIVTILLILVSIGILVMVVLLLNKDILPMSNFMMKILNYMQACFALDEGIMTSMMDACGIIGIVAIIYLSYATLFRIVIESQRKENRNFWIYIVVGIVYCLQILGLMQSVRTTLLYAVIMFLGLAQNRVECK